MTDVGGLVPEGWGEQVVEELGSLVAARPLAVGDVLRGPSDVDAAVFLLADGLVSVRDDEGRELAQLGPGAWVGEMSWLGATPPVARVQCVVAGEALVVEGPALDDLQSLDVVVDHLERLAERRAATNRAVSRSPVGFARGGVTVQVRPMWPDDWRRLDAGRDRVSPESLRRRFFTQPTFTEARLRRLTDVDFRDEFVWVVSASTELVAVGRYGRPVESPDAAEIALLVADDWHGRGLGRLLMGALAVAADVQGIATFEALTAQDNRPVHGLLDRYDVSWSTGDDPTTRVARWSVASMLDHPDVREVDAALRPVAEAVVRG